MHYLTVVKLKALSFTPLAGDIEVKGLCIKEDKGIVDRINEDHLWVLLYQEVKYEK